MDEATEATLQANYEKAQSADAAAWAETQARGAMTQAELYAGEPPTKEPYLEAYRERNIAAEAYQVAHPEANWWDALAGVGAAIPAYMLSTYVPPEPTLTMLTMTPTGLGYSPSYLGAAVAAGVEPGTPIRAEEPLSGQIGVIPDIGGPEPPILVGTAGGRNIIEPITGSGGVIMANGEVKPGDSPGIIGMLQGVAGASTVTSTLTKLGLPLKLAGAVGVAYGALKIAGMAFPWETAEGEGFLAPWTPKTKDENGKWVSIQTRPDLFGGVANPLGQVGGGTVVKSWQAGGWPFSMTSDGRIHTITKNGIMKSWKPKKPIVMFRGSTTLSQAVKAQRYLDKQWRTVAKRVKQLKMA